MALTVAERRAVVLALLAEFDEDYIALARIVRALRAALPAAPLKAELDGRLAAHLAARGVSVQWFADEVARLSQ